MAAEALRADTTALLRLLILECASEDCYGLMEFSGNMLGLYPSLERAAALAIIKRHLREMVEEGLVRVHRGFQCSGDSRAGDELTVPASEIESLADDVWNPYTEHVVYVCDTEQTFDAYNKAYQLVHG